MNFTPQGTERNSPNIIQTLVHEWLLHSGLDGDELLLESLLRRGFLAYRDGEGVWLGTGSHQADIDVLRLIEGLEIKEVSGHTDRMAAIRLRPFATDSIVSSTIMCLPEHDRGFTEYGPGGWTHYSDQSWERYRHMVWGAKRPVCPASILDGNPVYDALDTGVALLVRTLPLARVATALSCDGHGNGPAYVEFFYPWDRPWGEAVFHTLELATPHSQWRWIGRSDEEGKLVILPKDGYGDEALLGMLDDIQRFSRKLLDQRVIDRIGRARSRMLARFEGQSPAIDCFAEEARRQLAKEIR